MYDQAPRGATRYLVGRTCFKIETGAFSKEYTLACVGNAPLLPNSTTFGCAVLTDDVLAVAAVMLCTMAALSLLGGPPDVMPSWLVPSST